MLTASACSNLGFDIQNLNMLPWVALHCRGDSHHGWAATQLAAHPGPFHTCEAVVTETCFLPKRGASTPPVRWRFWSGAWLAPA
jgi:hypothetical protein